MAMIVFLVVLFAGVVSAGVSMFRWQYRKAERQLQSWAQRSRYQLLDKQEANPFGTGPMARSGNKQVMYRVTISDENGARRSGLVKIGSPTLGVLANELVVEWENGSS
jgi:hypothetical protein